MKHRIRYTLLMGLFFVVIVQTSFTKSSSRVKEFVQHLQEHPTHKIEECFFVPADKPLPLLIYLISQTKKSICCALYNFTSEEVCTALIEARERGVMVEVVADIEALRTRSEQISRLFEHNVKVTLYARYRSIMHNKYFVFNDTVGHKNVLFSGSANCTAAGLQSNEENVIVTDNPYFVQQYTTNFERIKQKMATTYSNKKIQLRPGCWLYGRDLIIKFRNKVLKKFRVIW